MGRNAIKRAQEASRLSSEKLSEVLRKQGVDTKALSKLTSYVYCLADVAEQKCIEINKLIKGKKMSFPDKKNFIDFHRLARRLQKSASLDLKQAAQTDGIEDEYEYTTKYGDDSDFIREIIDNAIDIRDECRDDYIEIVEMLRKIDEVDIVKLKSTMKLFVKPDKN